MRALIVSQGFRRFWGNMVVSTDGWLFAETDSVLNSSQVLFSLKEKIKNIFAEDVSSKNKTLYFFLCCFVNKRILLSHIS